MSGVLAAYPAPYNFPKQNEQNQQNTPAFVNQPLPGLLIRFPGKGLPFKTSPGD